MIKRIALGTALAVALTASAASAGTYVTGALPSEFGGGFIPPDAKVLKNVQKASKEGAKLAASVEKCYSKGAANYSKNKATGVDTCLNDVKKGVHPEVPGEDRQDRRQGAGPAAVPRLLCRRRGHRHPGEGLQRPDVLPVAERSVRRRVHQLLTSS